jgi:phosphoglycerate dehydrogenase-like enzyme
VVARRRPAEARRLGAELSDPDPLCTRSDIVTLHAPDLPETRRLIDEWRLSPMPDGAVLINTARGALVDTEALTRHCRSGRIDAVLDVTDPEMLPAEHPLFALPMFCSPRTWPASRAAKSAVSASAPAPRPSDTPAGISCVVWSVRPNSPPWPDRSGRHRLSR